MADGFPLKAGMAFLVGARQRQDSQRHREGLAMTRGIPKPVLLVDCVQAIFAVIICVANLVSKL
jgi:hypothetical protein